MRGKILLFSFSTSNLYEKHPLFFYAISWFDCLHYYDILQVRGSEVKMTSFYHELTRAEEYLSLTSNRNFKIILALKVLHMSTE